MASAAESRAVDQTGDDGADVTIARDPHRPGAGRARLAAYGVPVWALIGYLGDEREDEEAVGQVAEGFRVPVAAIRAAIDYYGEHRAVIDALIARNSVAAQVNGG